jgi:hypothetical protein
MTSRSVSHVTDVARRHGPVVTPCRWGGHTSCRVGSLDGRPRPDVRIDRRARGTRGHGSLVNGQGTWSTPGWKGDASMIPPQALISAAIEMAFFDPGTDTVIFGASVQSGSLLDGVATQYSMNDA